MPSAFRRIRHAFNSSQQEGGRQLHRPRQLQQRAQVGVAPAVLEHAYRGAIHVGLQGESFLGEAGALAPPSQVDAEAARGARAGAGLVAGSPQPGAILADTFQQRGRRHPHGVRDADHRRQIRGALGSLQEADRRTVDPQVVLGELGAFARGAYVLPEPQQLLVYVGVPRAPHARAESFRSRVNATTAQTQDGGWKRSDILV
jgi:hypothetical protein